MQSVLREEELRKPQRNALRPRRHRQVRARDVTVVTGYASGAGVGFESDVVFLNASLSFLIKIEAFKVLFERN